MYVVTWQVHFHLGYISVFTCKRMPRWPSSPVFCTVRTSELLRKSPPEWGSKKRSTMMKTLPFISLLHPNCFPGTFRFRSSTNQPYKQQSSQCIEITLYSFSVKLPQGTEDAQDFNNHNITQPRYENRRQVHFDIPIETPG